MKMEQDKHKTKKKNSRIFTNFLNLKYRETAEATTTKSNVDIQLKVVFFCSVTLRL